MPVPRVSIVDGPLGSMAAERLPTGAGAVATFEGIVRPAEGGRPIAGLRYDTYDPMAERVLTSLARAASERFGIETIHVEHSRGFVGAGERSFRLVVTSAHRRAALDALDWFIDQMKRDAPIWKSPVFGADGEAGASTDRPGAITEAPQ